MNRIDQIKSIIKENLHPLVLEMYDDSHKHAHHAQNSGGEFTHLRIVIVSQKFKDLNQVQRQRIVYSLIDAEFKKGLHALQLATLTLEEFEALKKD